jgi:hypothetical protein
VFGNALVQSLRDFGPLGKPLDPAMFWHGIALEFPVVQVPREEDEPITENSILDLDENPFKRSLQPMPLKIFPGSKILRSDEHLSSTFQSSIK